MPVEKSITAYARLKTMNLGDTLIVEKAIFGNYRNNISILRKIGLGFAYFYNEFDFTFKVERIK